MTKKYSFLLLLTIISSLFARAQQAYWQQEVNYSINVTLDDKTHSLDAFAKIEYINHSPDTLRFIWFHLWPNAYKNDKTAFSDQLLEQGRTDFYFADPKDRGYINRLDFKVNGLNAVTSDDEEHIDIIKLILPAPLAPGEKINISTPFHVKLPYLFSRLGHIGQSYHATQWYPKPAVYDRKGWHTMPYLDQGEFYSEFGSFDVQISVPANYVVAATGELQNADALAELKANGAVLKNAFDAWDVLRKKMPVIPRNKKVSLDTIFPVSSPEMKTLRYKQDKVHDFAWFADKRFSVNYDTLQLESGRIIDLFAYYVPKNEKINTNNILPIMKTSVRHYSSSVGAYPYNTISVVMGAPHSYGGMEYPTITIITPSVDEEIEDKNTTILHEIGHNWFYGILASNEREHPWMDEGLNSYYERRYDAIRKATIRTVKKGFAAKIPDDQEDMLFRNLVAINRDQAIGLSAPEYTLVNYAMSVYYKTARMLEVLEKEIGREKLDSAIQKYFREWQFKHPQPEDLLKILSEAAARPVAELQQRISSRGLYQDESNVKKKTKLVTFFNLTNTDRYKYISLSPMIGYNSYDQLMIGGMIHNYQLPLQKFRFLAIPLYATGSAALNGLARFSYHWYPNNGVKQVELSAAGARFTGDRFQPDGKPAIYLSYNKLVPGLKISFREKNPRSERNRYLQLKYFYLSEEQLQFGTLPGSGGLETVGKKAFDRSFAQLKLVAENNRVLYPYRGELQVDYVSNFVRAAFTGNYFFNYNKRGKGLNLRVFGGKFFYIGQKTFLKQFETERYHFNLSGANGAEDYSYSNYFIGRNKFEGFASQQMMIRDGAFKVRTDLLSSKVGKTDDWLGAINLTTDIPDQINPLSVLPVKIPLKAFVDIGSFSEAWDRDGESDRFLFDAGIQVSLFGETVNIYIPLLYSKVFKNYYETILTEKTFSRKISFSIDIQNLTLRKLNLKPLF
jgi:Peptidase family M1 domain